jgi:hypothetical protein
MKREKERGEKVVVCVCVCVMTVISRHDVEHISGD